MQALAWTQGCPACSRLDDLCSHCSAHTNIPVLPCHTMAPMDLCFATFSNVCTFHSDRYLCGHLHASLTDEGRMGCLSVVFVDKVPYRSNLREERLVFGSQFRRHSPSWWRKHSSWGGEIYGRFYPLPHGGRKEARNELWILDEIRPEVGLAYNPQRPTFNDPPPATRPPAPNSTTCKGPCVQILYTVGHISHPTVTIWFRG